ncbi:MAG: DUF560 domain-containing protein [Desulfobacteraceae bacterium]|nr:DUF560 domain-containing protein [Desulfobacteraceae bacterium]
MKKSLILVLIILFVLFLCLPVCADEDRGRAYYDLGVFAYEDGDLQDAETNLKDALRLAPDNPHYNHYLGKTYIKTGQFKEAEQYLDKAWKTDPEIFGLKYDIALLKYKTGNFTEAADLFTDLADKDPSDVLSSYNAGMSLFKLEQYKRSLVYFDMAVEKSPAIRSNTDYYSGICYLKMGDDNAAIEKFEHVRDNAESESLREYAANWLRAMKKRKTLKPYSIYLKIGYQYDDNVRLEPLEQEDLYADEEDYVAKGYFSFNYNVINQSKLKLGAGYSHYQTWHNDLSEYDLTGSIGNIYAKYRMDKATLGISYLPSYYWLESDSFLARHQVRPDLTWKIDNNILAKLSYSYSANDYFQSNDSDGHTNEVNSDFYYSLGEKGYLFWGLGYENNSASASDKDYALMETNMGVSFKMPWDINFSLTGKYTNKKYDDYVSGSDPKYKRNDIKYYSSASLSRSLFYDWLSILFEFDYTKNDSNNIEYEYERKTATVSLKARY